MAFLQNCWYVAAWSDEIGETPLGRRILDKPVVLFRSLQGEPVALQGMCPHRFAPMHLGKLVDGNIQCAYHGLQFNTGGKCVFNPQGNGAMPGGVRLESYPVIERYGACWIWMGDAEQADLGKLPELPAFEYMSRFAVVRGYMHSAANYKLLADNIMDLGHVDFLHQSSLGCDATARAKTSVYRNGNQIHCDRWMENDYQGPLLSWLFDRQGQKVDAWIDVRWNPPCLMQLIFGMTDIGAVREAGMEIPNLHLVTPETEFSSHYFWASARDFQTDDEELSQQLYEGITAAFMLEDKPMIEAQQAMMGTTDLWSLKPALLAGDAAPVLARRVLETLIREENLPILRE